MKASSRAEEDVTQAQRELWEAFFRRDVKKLEGLLIPEGYVHTDIDGNVFDKPGWLAWLAAIDSSVVPSYSVSDVKVQFYGDTAVLTGRLTVRGPLDSPRHDIRVTNVWVKYSHKWLRAAYQGTRIEQS